MSCRSEFLVCFIKTFHLLVISIYHPFWNDADAHKEAISCLCGLIDFAFIKYGSNIRVCVVGDFNDLRNHFSTITQLTRLIPLVDFPTRGSHCLDQVFPNFATDQKPSVLPPIGRSESPCSNLAAETTDHCSYCEKESQKVFSSLDRFS